MYQSGSSGSSSDSDHQTDDLAGSHTIVLSQDVGRQTVIQGDNTNIYEEIQRVNQQAEHLDSTMMGLPIDSPMLSSSNNLGDSLEQRFHEVMQQREQFQRMEVEIRAQFVARSEVMRVQRSFDEQSKQQASIVASLQEQLQEREHRIRDLEQQLDQRERQLQANQREATEAVNQVWAKDGLLREQTNELATLRRERDNALGEQKAALAQFEAERAQLLSQLHDLKDQVQEKEHQLQELHEQHRSTQDALIFKDEQLREAQTWMQRAQELDAFHVNAQSSLHAELRDRTDQMNQLWLGYQKQLAEVERYHAQTIQRLRMEVAELREQNRMLRSASSSHQTESKDEDSTYLKTKEGGPFNVADQSGGSVSKFLTSGLAVANNQVNMSVLPSETVGSSQNNLLQREVPAKQLEHATVLPVVASPTFGMGAVLPSCPVPVLHQFAGQPQGMTSAIAAAPSQITQSASNQFSNPVIIQTQHQLPTVHQQTMQHNSKQIQHSQSSQVQRYPHRQQLHSYIHAPSIKPSNAGQPRPTDYQQQQPQHEQHEQNPLRQNAVHNSQPLDAPGTQHFNIQVPVHQVQTGGHMLHLESNQLPEQHLVSQVQVQHVHDRKHAAYARMLPQPESQQQQLQSQQEGTAQQLHSGQVERQSIDKGQNPDHVKNFQAFSQQLELHQMQVLPTDVDFNSQATHHQFSTSSAGEQHLTGSQSSVSQSIVNFEANTKHGLSTQSLQTIVPSTVQPLGASEGSSKGAEPKLLDEKSLLACLVRVIPVEASARIKISTTLPNRLGKMLAPLHWHDYKKQYGRLDEFVNSHPELFVIDGDFIHLREGAHAIISASTTVAKVAAAAAAASPFRASWSPTVAVTPVAQSQMQRSRKVVIARRMDMKQVHASTHLQAANIQQEGLFPQPQNSEFITRNIDGEIRASQSQPVIVSSDGITKSGGEMIMMMLGSRPDGFLPRENNVNEQEFEKLTGNNYGSSTPVTQKDSTLYGSRQTTRTTVLVSGTSKEDFIALPQTQENTVA